jgi:L-asparagine oxygenase
MFRMSTVASMPAVSHPPVRAVAVEAAEANWLSGLEAALDANAPVSDALADHAAQLSGRFPSNARAAIVDFADDSDPSGALLITGLPVGTLPPTPLQRGPLGKSDVVSELTLLAAASLLGSAVGYAPEHGGAVVQNLMPLEATRRAQVSTSSDTNLFFHTETAFHPYRPSHLLLLCLRGDPNAHTTLCSLDAVLGALPSDDVSVLRQARFRTAVDASFGGTPDMLGALRPVIEETPNGLRWVFDADLMIGVDRPADEALRRLSSAVEERATSVVLKAGDLLVIDNHRAVHGRSPFPARFDGTDRWLQRAFVVADLAPSVNNRVGRTITLTWA